ncbi:MAG TPA: hypothetical protein VJG30_02330 [Candidatus Nanoarchaeia archaeon]|nr:hypothetical protein [Candidatus Nanoarchaeia archaeon]
MRILKIMFIISLILMISCTKQAPQQEQTITDIGPSAGDPSLEEDLENYDKLDQELGTDELNQLNDDLDLSKSL